MYRLTMTQAMRPIPTEKSNKETYSRTRKNRSQSCCARVITTQESHSELKTFRTGKERQTATFANFKQEYAAIQPLPVDIMKNFNRGNKNQKKLSAKHKQCSMSTGDIDVISNEIILKTEVHPLETYEVIQEDFLKFGGYVSLEWLLQFLKPGDLIEFYRLGYLHYALYLGNKKIMNIVANLYSDEAVIKEMPLKDVVKASGVRVCNHDDLALEKFDARRKPIPEIIEWARSFEGQTVPYELFGRNCEYYSTLWRYAVGFSTQVLITEKTQGGATAVEALRSIPNKLPEYFKPLLQSGVAWIEEQFTTRREIASFEMYKDLANKAEAMKSIKDAFTKPLK